MSNDTTRETRKRLAAAQHLTEQGERMAKEILDLARSNVVDRLANATNAAARDLGANRGETAIALCHCLGSTLFDQHGRLANGDPTGAIRTAALLTLITRSHALLIADQPAAENA